MSKKKVIKSSFWYIVSNIIIKAIAFITVPIFTRLLTQEQFGQFNNFNSWLQIIMIFFTLNSQNSLVTAKYDYKKDYDEYILSTYALQVVLWFIWLIIFNCFSEFFTEQLNLGLKYINYMIIYLFFYSSFQLFQTRAKMLYEYKSNVIMNVISSISTSFLSVVLVLTMKDKLEGRILGIVISIIFVGLYTFLKILKKGKKVNISYWKYALKTSLPYIPYSLAGLLLFSMDKIMITNMYGDEQNALYSLAIQCCTLIILFHDSLNNAIAPWIGDKINDKNFDEVKSVSKKYIILYVLIVFGIMLITPEMLMFMGGKKYMDAKIVLVPLALSYIFSFLYAIFVNVEQFKKKTIIMSVVTIIAAIINYLLNYFLLNKFGYIVSAYVRIISFICLLAMHMFIVYKIGYSKLYDYKFITFISIFSIIISIFINYSYSNILLRIILIIAYAFLIINVIMKQKIVNIKEIINIKKKN